MLISNNDPVKNISAEKPVNKSQKAPKVKDETIVRETTIQIKEEVKLTSKNKSGQIPSSTNIFTNPFINTTNPVSVSKSKALVDDIVELDFDDKASLVKKTGDFTKSIQGMNSNELIEVADYIRHLMQGTMGTDDILGGLQSTVFDTMKNNFNSPFNFVNPNITLISDK